jgi:hypothetical protein
MAINPATERVDTAIRLGRPDRVPVAPMLDMFACRYAGVTQHDMIFSVKRGDAALARVHEDLGPLDGYSMSNSGFAKLMRALAVVPPVLPGVDGTDENAVWQFNEKTVMKPEEYGALAADPRKFLFEKALIHNPAIRNRASFAYEQAMGYHAMLQVAMSARRWRRRGVEPIVAANVVLLPFEYISTVLRSVTDIMTDLFRHPDELTAACAALIESDRSRYLVGPRLSGVRRVIIGLTRTSATFLSPRQFERFALPQLSEICEYLTGHGMSVILHMDNDWTPHFKFFQDWPRGKYVINLDGSSDIFKAKEMLGDRMCIMGDVPASLLKLGEPEEVDEYCRRLIREVGADGGFILSSGCDVPIDAKPENVKAMIQSVYRYGIYT